MTIPDMRARAAAIVGGANVSSRKGSSEIAWGLALPEPADLAALHAESDGLELADGTRILGRAEIGPATRWLREERDLGWSEDLLVIGERDDWVIVRDLDVEGRRAGGGVLEAPSDGLMSFRRVARDLLGYLMPRAGVGPDPDPAPEQAARQALAQRDAAALARAISEPFYPGSEMNLAHAALSLGELHARAGDMERALEAFTLCAETRARAARRGAEAAERSAAFRACARAAEAAGATHLAEVCRARAGA